MKSFVLFFLITILPCRAAYQVTANASSIIVIPGGTKNVDSSTNSVSIAMWAYLETPFINTAMNLICKGRSNDLNKILFHIWWLTNYLQFRYASPNGTFHVWQTTSTYPTNSLHHIAATFTYGTGSSFKLYIDGVSVPGSWIVGTGNANGLVNDQSLQTAGVASFDSPLHGTINDVAVWYAVLDDRQIQNLASRVKRVPSQYKPESIIMYYAFDDWAQFTNPGSPANGEGLKDSGFQRQNPRIGNSATPACKIGFERWLSYPPNE